LIALENALIVLSALILGAGFALSVRNLLAPLQQGTGKMFLVNGAAFIVLLAAIAVDFGGRGIVPLSTLRDSMLLFAAVLLAVSTIMMRATGSPLLVLLTVPVVVLLQVLSLFFDHWFASPESSATLGTTLTTVHVLLFLVSYAFLFMAAVFSAMFLLMDRFLKEKAYSPVFFKLPGLAKLDAYAYGSALAGLGLLTGAVAMALAALRAAPGASAASVFTDYTMFASLILWAYYAAYVLLRIRARVVPRRASYLAICGLALILFFYFSSKVLRPSGLHGFGFPRASAEVRR
jgi:ABC-type uncharacterized transport system permease subunit